MVHLFPEAAVTQMGIVEEVLRRAHRTPGEAAFLGGVIDFLRRQPGDEIRDHIIDDVRGVRRDDRRVLVFRVLQVAGHAVAVEQVCQFAKVFRVEPTRHQRADIAAVLGAELGARGRSGGMVATGLAAQHLSAIDVVGDRRLGCQCAGLVDRGVDILASP